MGLRFRCLFRLLPELHPQRDSTVPRPPKLRREAGSWEVRLLIVLGLLGLASILGLFLSLVTR